MVQKRMNKSALEQYKKVGNESNIAYASPHRLIQMLFEGAIEKISIAKGSMQRGEIAHKGQNISWAISIIEGLRTSLDKSSGSEIADNLDTLYTYMSEQLAVANLENSVDKLDEVTKLLRTVKTAWDDISEVLPAGTQLEDANRDNILTTTVR